MCYLKKTGDTPKTPLRGNGNGSKKNVKNSTSFFNKKRLL